MHKQLFRRSLVGLFFYFLFAILASPKCRADAPSWIQVGPTGGIIDKIAVAPADPNVIYACNQQDGIFKTVDGGKTWGHFSGVKGKCLNLFVDTENSDLVYLFTGNGFYKTNDGGMSWNELSSKFPLKLGLEFGLLGSYVHPKKFQTMYVYGYLYGGSSHELVFKSTDGGISWSKIKINVAGCDFNTEPILEVDSNNPDTFYIYATSGGETCNSDKTGIYKTKDGGISWSLIKNLGNYNQVDLIVDKSNTNTLYLYSSYNFFVRSDDGGTSWKELNISKDLFGQLTVDFSGSLYLLAQNTQVDSEGVTFLRSDDKGNSWIELKSDLFKIPVPYTFGRSFGYSEKDKNSIFLVGGVDGVLKSSDKGANWNQVNGQLYAYSDIGSNFVAYKSHIYAVIARTTPSYGIYSIYSDNSGKDWKNFDQALVTPSYFSDVTYDPFASKLLIATNRGLFVNDDQEKWKVTSLTGNIDHIVVDEEGAGILYAADYNGLHIFISTNHAKTWELFAEVEDTVSGKFKKEDLGSLTTLVTDVQSFRSLKSIKVNGAKSGIYAISISDSSANIKKSTDNRKTWTILFQSSSPLNDIEFIPQTETIYRASSDGVSRSTDLGKTWEPLNNGFSDLNVVSLQLDESTGSLYAGTRSNQIFKMEGVAPPLDLTASANSSTGGCALVQSTSSLAMTLSPRGKEKWFGSILFLFGVGILFLKRRILCWAN